MHAVRRTHLVAAVALACVGLLVFAAPSRAQLFEGPTTTTTAPPSTTTPPSTAPPMTVFPGPTTSTTAPPSTTSTTAASTTAPPASTTAPAATDSEGGDGIEADGPIPRAVPPDAQRIIDAVPRSGPSSTDELYEAVRELVELGLTEEEAIRIGFGRFPIAGVANYSHDWLFPRYGPGFRFHHGTDVFAPFGTPLRATVEGIATAKTSSLGGLSVKVTMPDGTYFYYAHLSALADDFVNGMAVETGDIVGYVGDSGNAKGGSPHLHIGVYPNGGEATDPKPILDGFIADAMEALPGIIDQVRAERGTNTDEAAPTPRTPRSAQTTRLLEPLADRTDAVSTEVLYQASGNPSGGGVSVAETEAQQLAASIDWGEAERRATAERLVRNRTMALVHLALGPFAAASAELASR